MQANQKRPREFTYFVHENSPFMSTRSLPPLGPCSHLSPFGRNAGKIKFNNNTVKLGDKEQLDKEQIGVKEPFPVTNCQFTT